MAVSAGDAFLDVHSRLAANFGRQLSSQVQGPITRAGEQASHHFGRSFARGLKTASVAIGVGLAAATVAATKGILASTKAASDLNEQVSKSNVIFGSNAKAVQRWSRGTATALGLSRTEAITSASAFGDMFRQLGLGLPTTTKMSTRMVQLASDLASFSNADITQVLEAQQAAFRGEFDSLQRFIPNINAARVQQEALRETHKKSAKDLTASEKAQATYNIMLHDSVRATGDFQRTSQGLANQQRIAKAQWENLKTTIGQGFLPAQLAVTKAVTSKLLPALGVLAKDLGPKAGAVVARLANSFAASLPSTKEFGFGLAALGAAFSGEGITTSADSFVGKMERLGVAGRKAVDWVKHFRSELSQVGPALQQAGGGGHVFANSLSIIGPVLEVVARNLHNIVPWLPAILAGFLAFRAIRSVTTPLLQVGELISNIAAPFRIAALFAQNRALKAHTIALTENTIAIGGNTAATVASTGAANVGILASIRARAAMIGQAVAAKAVAVATRAWAAVQWLINAALTANPIGLVIVAVAALVAGIVLAYKHSETFRKIVDGAFRAVAAAGSWMWNSVLKPVFRFLVNTFLDVAGAIVHGAASAFGWVPGIGGKLKSAAKTFDTFRDDVNRKLAGIKDQQVKVTATAVLETFTSSGPLGIVRRQARGGPTRLGVTTLVGEEGPELVQFSQPGRVYTAAQTRRLMAGGMARGGPVGDAGDAPGVRVFPFGSVSNLERNVPKVNAQLARIADQLGGALKRFLIPSGRIGRILKFLTAQLGEPYQWGATGPDRWDCSGLMLRGYATAGVRLPRVAAQQARAGHGVSRASARLGDLIYFGSPAHHIGFYLGGNRMLHAPHTGDVVRVSGGRVGTGYRRVLDSGGWLMPGESGINLTRKPERVLGPGERGGDTYYFDFRNAIVGDRQALYRDIRAGVSAAQARDGIPPAQRVR